MPQLNLKALLTPTPKNFSFKKGGCQLKETPLPIVFANGKAQLLSIAQNLQSHLKTLNICSKILASFDDSISGIYLTLENKKEQIPEAYEISVNQNQILITAWAESGLFYGVQTLKQLFNIYSLELPQLHIKDAPYFSMRGFYHDVTRSKTPTLETLKELVRKASFYKINQLQLYIEHTFAFRCLPELWADKDPLTAEEILELDEYASKHFVELVPSLSTFGHLYEFLRLPKYQHLNELELDASKLPFSLHDRMQHYTLDVSQKESFEIVQNMLKEFIPLFKSNNFNICCDETFDLGQGKNKDKAAKLGKGNLYINFLLKIIHEVKKYKLKPMFWGDIILHSPELIKKLPKDLVYLNWNYSANPSENSTKTFAKNKITQVLCPGVWGWNHYLNNLNKASSNIATMTNYARKYKALGVLNTDWGDFGHVNLLATAYHGMAFGAACSWADKNPDANDFDKAFSLQNWGETTNRITSLLRKLSDDKNIYRISYCAGWLNQEEWFKTVEEEIKKIPLSKLYKNLKELKLAYQELKSLALQNSHTQDMQELLLGSRLNIWSHQLLLLKNKYEFGNNKTKLDLKPVEFIKEGYQITEEYTKLWRKRNKESQLCHSRDIFIAICQKVQSWV